MRPSEREGRLAAQIVGWRDELINLTRTNRLLYFRHTLTASLEILEPGMSKVFDQLEKDKQWEFSDPPVDSYGRPTDRRSAPRANELVTDKLTPIQLSKSLRAIEKRALDTFTERGLWTMYVGVAKAWRRGRTTRTDGSMSALPL